MEYFVRRHTIKNGSEFIDDQLVISCHDDIRHYCDWNHIAIEDFNNPVFIDPYGKKYTCASMFAYCRSFNQPVSISMGTKNCEEMFEYCESFNQPIEIPESVENAFGMFYNCISFNQEVTIPGSVTQKGMMFYGCKSLNKICRIKGDVDQRFKSQMLINYFVNVFETDKYPFNLEDHIKAIFGRPVDVIYDDSVTIRIFDQLMQYTFDHDLIEMRARLLEFKNNHRDEFPDPLHLDI